MKSKNILEIFEANQQYKTCNIEFEPFGGAEDGVDFRPVLDMKEQNIQLRQKLETLIAFIKGEWQDCETICNILGIEFKAGLAMFDFSRTAEWNPAPLNGQKITTKFRPKEFELRGRLKELQLQQAELIHRFQAQKYYHNDLRREMVDMLLDNLTEECRKKLIELVATALVAKLRSAYENWDKEENILIDDVCNRLDQIKADFQKTYSRAFYSEVLAEGDKEKHYEN